MSLMRLYFFRLFMSMEDSVRALADKHNSNAQDSLADWFSSQGRRLWLKILMSSCGELPLTANCSTWTHASAEVEESIFGRVDGDTLKGWLKERVRSSSALRSFDLGNDRTDSVDSRLDRKLVLFHDVMNS